MQSECLRLRGGRIERNPGHAGRLKMGDESLMLRDAVADQQHFDGLAAAKQQQQQMKAAQQKAPTL